MDLRIRAFSRIIEFFEKRPLLIWTLTIIYAAMIFYFSSKPTPLPEGVSKAIPSTFLHFLEYIGFGILLFASFLSSGNKKKTALLLAVIVAAIYGITDEIHQYFVPGRVCSVIDATADALGGITGALIGVSQKH